MVVDGFTGQPFDLAMGSVYGVRRWRVEWDRINLLAPYAAGSFQWTPGESVSRCHRSHDLQGVCDSVRPGRVICMCGFWAFHRGGFRRFMSPDNAIWLGSDITGIIEAYGRMVIGERGFRCQKAKVVAFVRRGSKIDAAVERELDQRWDDVPIYRTLRGAMWDFPILDLAKEYGHAAA